jgi:hypothetical protein
MFVIFYIKIDWMISIFAPNRNLVCQWVLIAKLNINVTNWMDEAPLCEAPLCEAPFVETF